jgi:spermidine/putrescine transport system permease protein
VSFLLVVPSILWPMLLLVVPLAVMICTTFIHSTQHVFTLERYLHFCSPLYVSVLLRSFILASSTALCTLLLGYPVAYFVAIYAKRMKFLLLFLLTLPFWTNFIVQVYSWFFILEREGLLNALLLKMGIITQSIQFAYNIGAVLLLMTYCYLPFMIMPIYTVLQKMDILLLEASMDLGATRWQTFVRITLPLSLSGVRTGIALVFVPAFGEFVIPALVGGSRYLTAGSLISYYYLVSHDIALGSAFTVIVGLMLMLSVVLLHYVVRVYKS